MEKEKPKILHTELKGNLSTRFDIIKSALGIQNDAEVVRYLIQNYFKESLEGQKMMAREQLEEDREIIKKFMKKYGEEWRNLGED
jgi:CHAD domain-containing protein